MDESFFYAKYENGKTETRGLESSFLGNKIDRGTANRPDGIYAGWKWDGKRLSVNNDKYGYYPLYYYHRGNEISLSSSISKLLNEGASRELDYDALSVFLRVGFYIGEDTPLKHIKVIPPDTSFCWSMGKLDVSGTHSFTARKQDLSFDDAVDKFIYLFRGSMQRRLPEGEDFVVPLSGGFDSRNILLELNRLKLKPKFCITSRKYGWGEDEDIDVAKILTDRLDIKHVIKEHDNPRIVDEINNINDTSFCADENAWTQSMVNYLKGKTKIVYDGLGFDMLASYVLRMDVAHCNELFRSGRFEELAKEIFFKYPSKEEMLKLILKDKYYKRMSLECASRRIIEQLKKHRSSF